MLLEKTDQIKWDKLVSGQLAVWQVRQTLRRQQPSIQPEGPWSHALITISRTHGAGGDDIAHETGKILRWPVYDRELVEYIAQTAHVRQQVVESLDEHRRSETENWMQTLLDRGALGTDKYLKHLMTVLLTIGEHGQAIIIGRGGNFVLVGENVLRVLITAPLEWRAKQLAEKRDIPTKEAKKIIAKVDDDRSAYLEHYFHREANDPTAYDLVLNVEYMNPRAAAQTIVAALEQRLGVPRPVWELSD